MMMFSTANALLDPNMPKRGLSAYMFFANDTRDKVREDNPGIKFGTFDRVFPAFRPLLIPYRRGWQAAG